MPLIKFCTLLVLTAVQFVSISSFVQLSNRIVKQTISDSVSTSPTGRFGFYIYAKPPPPIDMPTTVNSRLKVTISGPSISSALFRAELKKELCFFRGCRALFSAPDNLSGLSELTCEGRTTQIVRFLTWLEQLSTDVSERKANFQGPSLVAYIDKICWEEYTVWISIYISFILFCAQWILLKKMRSYHSVLKVAMMDDISIYLQKSTFLYLCRYGDFNVDGDFWIDCRVTWLWVSNPMNRHHPSQLILKIWKVEKGKKQVW